MTSLREYRVNLPNGSPRETHVVRHLSHITAPVFVRPTGCGSCTPTHPAKPRYNKLPPRIKRTAEKQNLQATTAVNTPTNSLSIFAFISACFVSSLARFDAAKVVHQSNCRSSQALTKTRNSTAKTSAKISCSPSKRATLKLIITFVLDEGLV